MGAAEGTRSYDKTMLVVLGKTGLHAFQAIMITSRIGSLLGLCIFIGAWAWGQSLVSLCLQ